MKRILCIALVAAAALAVGTAAMSGESAKAGKKSRYLVIAPHTAEQCLATLDEINHANAKSLAQWDFGCKSGDHTGYLITMAASDDEAKAMVPASGRDQAKVIKVSKFTAADLKMAHQEMDKK